MLIACNSNLIIVSWVNYKFKEIPGDVYGSTLLLIFYCYVEFEFEPFSILQFSSFSTCTGVDDVPPYLRYIQHDRKWAL